MQRMTVQLLAFAVALITVSCLDISLDDRWAQFKRDNKRRYNVDVEEYRRGIWEAKVKEIQQHNIEAEEGRHTYTMQETEWDDLTYEEFMHFGGGWDVNDLHRVKRAGRNGSGDCFEEQSWNDSFPYTVLSAAPLPRQVDWTKKGYVTSVKNQGRCGSCWAFSSVGAIEGQWYKKTKKLVSLSPQFLVDCSRRNKGCGGGLPSRAFADLMEMNGIPSEKSYPYKAKKGECRASVTPAAQVTGYKTINSTDELTNAVAYVGPVSVGIQTGPKLSNVGKGVFTDCTGPINHAVLVVGYGVYNGRNVWKVKNSWGPDWGDNGFFFMARGGEDCGIARYASYPTMAGVRSGPVDAGKVTFLQSVSGCDDQQKSFQMLVLTFCFLLMQILIIN